jgi:hypothetical protein
MQTAIRRGMADLRVPPSCSAAVQDPPATNTEPKYSMEDIVNVCKRRGFVFQSSEIYNGFNGFYDYGPLGGEYRRLVGGR